MKDEGFARVNAGHNSISETMTIFGKKEEMYSSYGRCAGCPYLGSCRVCPISIALDPANPDPHHVPDFICAFNRVALKYRSMFPVMPDPLERLNSLASLAKPPRPSVHTG